MKTIALPVLLFSFAISQIGCSAACWQGFAQGFAKGLANTPAYTGTNQKLMLFGGQNNKTYLGCLSCSEYSSDSILNEYGNYGSEYSDKSIWNEYGNFGSEYSQYSPWNSYAMHPPVIVDEQGNFYGYFTINKYHAQRTTIPAILDFLDAYNQ